MAVNKRFANICQVSSLLSRAQAKKLEQPATQITYCNSSAATAKSLSQPNSARFSHQVPSETHDSLSSCATRQDASRRFLRPARQPRGLPRDLLFGFSRSAVGNSCTCCGTIATGIASTLVTHTVELGQIASGKLPPGSQWTLPIEASGCGASLGSSEYDSSAQCLGEVACAPEGENSNSSKAPCSLSCHDAEDAPVHNDSVQSSSVVVPSEVPRFQIMSNTFACAAVQRRIRQSSGSGSAEHVTGFKMPE